MVSDGWTYDPEKGEQIAQFFQGPARVPNNPWVHADAFGGMNSSSWIPYTKDDPIGQGRVRYSNPYGDGQAEFSYFQRDGAGVVIPSHPYEKVFAPPVNKDAATQNPKAMPAFGQPKSPLYKVDAEQQVATPPAPKPAANATGMSTSLGAPGTIGRDVPPPETKA
jgi:hypothetical protein